MKKGRFCALYSYFILYIAFRQQPVDCYQRLLKIIELGSVEETIDNSIEDLRNLGYELMKL